MSSLVLGALPTCSPWCCVVAEGLPRREPSTNISAGFPQHFLSGQGASAHPPAPFAFQVAAPSPVKEAGPPTHSPRPGRPSRSSFLEELDHATAQFKNISHPHYFSYPQNFPFPFLLPANCLGNDEPGERIQLTRLLVRPGVLFSLFELPLPAPCRAEAGLPARLALSSGADGPPPGERPAQAGGRRGGGGGIFGCRQ